MAFINEYIPESDVKKYGLAEIDRKHLIGCCNSRDWTVDRTRNIYLRKITNPHREATDNMTHWTFYWKGTLLWFKRYPIAFQEGPQKPCWSHFRVNSLNIPEEVRNHREEIHNDLREAFLAYRTGGVYDTSAEYSMQLDIEE